MFAAFLKTLKDHVGVIPFADGDVVLATERVMGCFIPLTYGSQALSEVKEGDTIWVGHERSRERYFTRERVTAVERDKNRTCVRYGEYFMRLCQAYPVKNSLDGLICIVPDEVKLRRCIQ
jgi:hypothetical protein